MALLQRKKLKAEGAAVFVETLTNILGDYAMFPFPTGALTGDNMDPQATARLFGKRLAVASEANKRVPLNSAVINSYTGDGQLLAKFLYKDTFTFQTTSAFSGQQWLCISGTPGQSRLMGPRGCPCACVLVLLTRSKKSGHRGRAEVRRGARKCGGECVVPYSGRPSWDLWWSLRMRMRAAVLGSCARFGRRRVAGR